MFFFLNVVRKFVLNLGDLNGPQIGCIRDLSPIST